MWGRVFLLLNSIIAVNSELFLLILHSFNCDVKVLPLLLFFYIDTQLPRIKWKFEEKICTFCFLIWFCVFKLLFCWHYNAVCRRIHSYRRTQHRCFITVAFNVCLCSHTHTHSLHTLVMIRSQHQQVANHRWKCIINFYSCFLFHFDIFAANGIVLHRLFIHRLLLCSLLFCSSFLFYSHSFELNDMTNIWSKKLWSISHERQYRRILIFICIYWFWNRIVQWLQHLL